MIMESTSPAAASWDDSARSGKGGKDGVGSCLVADDGVAAPTAAVMNRRLCSELSSSSSSSSAAAAEIASGMMDRRTTTKLPGTADDAMSIIISESPSKSPPTRNVALTWLKSTKQRVMPPKARFPAPPPISEAEVLSLRAQGRAPPPNVDEPPAGAGIFQRALARIDLGPRPPPKCGGDAGIKFDVADATPESVCRAMKAEEALARRILRRRCWVWMGVAGLVGVLLACVVVVPVFIKVIIPNMVVDAFSKGSDGASPFTITEVSFLNLTETGATANFSAHMKDVAVPFNIPVRLRGPSTWTIRTLIRNTSEEGSPLRWFDMLRIPVFPSDAAVVDRRLDIAAKGFGVDVVEGGWPLAMFVKGLSRVFVDLSSDVVPLLGVGVEGVVGVGLLEYWGLRLERVVDLGKELRKTDLTQPSPGPNPTITAQEFTLTDNRIRTGLRIDLDPTLPTPLGFHLRNITFNLTLDGHALAHCHIPNLEFTSGATTLLLPLEVLPHVSSPQGNVSDVVAGWVVQGVGAVGGGARVVGVRGLTVLEARGRGVGWVAGVAREVEFEYPLEKLRGASGGVVGAWILGIVLRSLGVIVG
ncbi:hypothetical protein HDU67_006883 [Dinochytrium kinnereticum]|nr:hypothetical protein HDU67_006883 [Dinochytrium kinnereticum]